MRRQLAAGLALVLVSAAACGTTAGTALPVGVNSAGSGATTVPGTEGFLYANSSTVVYLQWPTNQPGFVSGSIKVDTVSGDPPNRAIKDTTDDFTGQINDSGAISLSLTVVSPWYSTVYGTLSGDALIMNLPQQGGGLQTITFRSATPDDYNTTLASLQDAVQQANRQSQQQQQIRHDEDALAKDFSSLTETKKSLSGNIDSLGHDVTSTDYDITNTNKDAATVQAEAGNGTDHTIVCGDATVVSGDATVVSGDATSLSGDLESLTANLSSLRKAIPALGDDLVKVEADEPGYQGAARTPSPTDVQQAINDINTTIAQTIAKANTDIDQENKDVAAAFATAETAHKAGNCGAGGSAPPPIPHTS